MGTWVQHPSLLPSAQGYSYLRDRDPQGPLRSRGASALGDSADTEPPLYWALTACEVASLSLIRPFLFPPRGGLFLPLLLMSKGRHREGKEVAQSHTAPNCWSPDGNWAAS